MRNTIVFSVICMCALAVLANEKVQPLNVKTGLWQVTMTSAVSGLPPIPPEMLARMTPEQRAKFEAVMKARGSGTPKTRTYTSCVTKEQLDSDPFSDNTKNCTRTVLRSTGSAMEIREVCQEADIKSDLTIQIQALDSENVKGSGHVTDAGGNRAMNIATDFTAKWLGAACTGK